MICITSVRKLKTKYKTNGKYLVINVIVSKNVATSTNIMKRNSDLALHRAVFN